MEKSNPNPCAIYWWIEGKKQGPRFYCTLYNAFIASTIKGASKIKKHVTIMTTISLYFYVQSGIRAQDLIHQRYKELEDTFSSFLL